MSTPQAPFLVEEREDITILTVNPPDHGLNLTDTAAMDSFWAIMHEVARKQQKVLLVKCGSNLMAPQRIDEAWQDIWDAARNDRELPPQILAIRSNVLKLIDYYSNSRTLCIGAFTGTVDFDMFGLFASMHYRICSTDTVLENRTLDRDAPPGSATVWYLSRVVGFTRTAEILLETKSLTATEAREMNLVNAVVPPAELDSFAEGKAEHFATKSRRALSSLVIALNHAHNALPEYLEGVGTGFNELFSE